MIIDLSLPEHSSPKDLSVEVLVIGSGPGGATAARALARAGREVLILEEGGDRTGARLTQRDAEMYDQLYAERGGRMSADLGISVLQGRALGGGSVINASDVVPLSDGVLAHWQSACGLTEFSVAALEPHRRAALEDLSANVPQEEQLNVNNRLLRSGSTALGFRGEVMMHNRVHCGGFGKCLIGCPLDAKRNARFVAIPQAIEAGARVLLRARAIRIEGAGNARKRVEVEGLDAAGYHPRSRFTISAKTVIIAANAIGSAALLLASGIGNAHTGRNLMLQPQLPIVAELAEPVDMFRGIPQAYAVTEFEEPADGQRALGGFRIEAIGGTPGIVASLLPAMGLSGKALMAGYAKIAAALILTPDAPSGRVEVERSGRLRVHYALSEEQRLRFRKGARAAARIYLAAGAKRVMVPSIPPVIIEKEADLAKLDALELRPASTPLLSAHQQGTVRFAGSAKDGAARPNGELWGARGVYVFDSSGYPSSASSHTMTPIISTASYLAAQLLAT